jgi:hypothetical protein
MEFEYFTLCGEKLYICNIIEDRITKKCFLLYLCSTILFASKQSFVFVIGLKILRKINSFNQSLFIYVSNFCTKIWILTTHELYNWWIVKIKVRFSYFTCADAKIRQYHIRKVHMKEEMFQAMFCSNILRTRRECSIVDEMIQGHSRSV